MCGSVFAVPDASGPLAEAHVRTFNDPDCEPGRHPAVSPGKAAIVPRFGHAHRGQVRNVAVPEPRNHFVILSGLVATVIE